MFSIVLGAGVGGADPGGAGAAGRGGGGAVHGGPEGVAGVGGQGLEAAVRARAEPEVLPADGPDPGGHRGPARAAVARGEGPGRRADGHGGAEGDPREGNLHRQLHRSDRGELRHAQQARHPGAPRAGGARGHAQVPVGESERPRRQGPVPPDHHPAAVQGDAHPPDRGVRGRHWRLFLGLQGAGTYGGRNPPARGVRAAAGVPDELRLDLAALPDLLGRRGAVRTGEDAVPRAGAHPAGAEPAAEAVRPLQHSDGQHRRVLRHRLERRGHREDQRRAARVPEPMSQAAQGKRPSIAMTSYFVMP